MTAEPALFDDEYLNYHYPDKPGFFKIAARITSTTSDREKWKEESYELSLLGDIIKYINPNYDTYITQAEFYKRSRRIVNLARVGLMFTDLDTHKLPGLKDVSPEQQADTVRSFCAFNDILTPSLIISSGRGLHLKWVLKTPVPRAALPRWNALQGELVNRFEDFAADPGAKDASRVLRLVNTVNTKTGEIARTLYQKTDDGNELHKYDFDRLCEEILPFPRPDKFNRPERKSKKETAAPGKRWFTPKSLCFARMEDLRALKEIRGGTIEEGSRHMFLFWALNFLIASGIADSGSMYYEAAALSKEINPHWKHKQQELSTIYKRAKMREAGQTVTWNGKEFDPIYRIKNDTLINLFGITDEEQKKMKTIISSFRLCCNDFPVKVKLTAISVARIVLGLP